jgi:TRAP-type mannitol/chloroaromatic compound transport system permease small subunit
MKSRHDIVEVVSLWMARIGGLMLLGASVVITVEIVLRKLFFLPFSIGTELSTYALAISGSWSFSYALLNRAHVRIDFLRNLGNQKVRTFLDVLALLVLGAAALVLARYAWDSVEASWSLGARENTSLGTPLIVPQGLWFLGLLWFAFVCLEQIVRVGMALLRGDLAQVASIAAPPNVDDEIEEALEAVEAEPVRIG